MRHLDSEKIISSFKSYFRGKGYRISPDRPLMTQDTGVFFVNSSMAPFKYAMSQGMDIDNTAQVQTCFRARFDTDWLLLFKMLGIVGIGSNLENIFTDVVVYLTNCLQISVGSMYCVANLDHTVFIDIWNKKFSSESLYLIDKETVKHKTTWSYGQNYPFVGKGITIGYKNPSLSKCSSLCDFDCSCPRFLPMGNIIGISTDSSHLKYVDVGFGVEFLEALQFEGNIFKIGRFSNKIKKIEQLNVSYTTAKQSLNLLRAIKKLFQEGCKVSCKKEGYILKMLIRKYTDLYKINKQHEFAQKKALEVANILGADHLIEEEIRKYSLQISGNIQKAKKFLAQKRATNSRSELIFNVRETFGFPDYMAIEIVDSVFQYEELGKEGMI